MNLPAYFLADLPPEAELTPKLVTEACRTLKENRERFLLPRPTADLVQLLCRVAADWRDPANPFRRHALDAGPAATGFSRPVLARGIDDFFALFTPAQFAALLDQELGHPRRLDAFTPTADPADLPAGRLVFASGPPLLAHIAAGNLPNPAWMSLTLGLLLRSAQFLKCANGTAFLPRLFAHSLYHHDRKIGACLEVAEWTGGNHPLEDALYAETHALTATGSDETLAAIRARIPDRVRFLGYGHRLSFALITREWLQPDQLADLVTRAADDLIAWDQHGCLSPHAIYIEERGTVTAEDFAAQLARELAQRESLLPRGPLTPGQAAEITSRRALYETLAAHRSDVKLWASPASTAWTVVLDHDLRLHPSCLNRFIYIKSLADAEALTAALDHVQPHLSTIGLAAPPARCAELAPRLARLGLLRICPLGRMQNPPLTWHHDGRPPLGDLVQWVDLETAVPPTPTTNL